MIEKNNKKVILGDFNAESKWEHSHCVKLPTLQMTQNKITLLDELLFAFCEEGDLLITKKPFHVAQKAILENLSIKFNTKNLLEESEVTQPKSVFELCKSKISPRLLEKYNHADFFAMDAYTNEMLNLFKIEQKVPKIDTTIKVNSKVFSFNLRDELGIKNYGVLVYDTESFEDTATNMLDKGKIIVKDVYGVSGKGAVIISSPTVIKSLAKYFRKQELEGAKMVFLIEEFLDKEIDLATAARIGEDGNIEILSTQQIINSNFCYTGTQNLSEEIQIKLRNSNFNDIITQIAEKVYKAGYFGDIGIDSMILTSGEIIPLVEINARKTMTSIKAALDQKFNRKGFMSMLRVINRAGVKLTYDDYIKQLEEKNLLYALENTTGILPLTANCYEESEKSNFHVFIVANTEDRMKYYIEKLENLEL